jgi:hypothetical protein
VAGDAVSISRRFNQPYFQGTTLSVTRAETTPFDVVINGRGYLIDLGFTNQPYQFESIPMLKAMFLQDRGTIPIGEHALNPDDYWRRSVDDWSSGAGQLALDHTDSVGAQYRTSKGVDPWTAGTFAMLPDTTNKFASSAPFQHLVVAGGYLYLFHSVLGLLYAPSLEGTNPPFTVVTGAGFASAVDLATDGYTVWAADTTRVYYSLRGSATYAAFHAADHVCSLLRVAKGRLFTAHGPTIYTHTLTAGTAVATAYFTHPNPDWTWTDIAGGPDSVYFAGFSGDKSAVYSAGIKSDGSALDAPAVVASLPDGEIARALQAYLSVLVIGTDKGFRIAEIGGSAGQLVLGVLIAMATPPRCFEPQDRFVWYGWSNYDTTSTGLGRMDLSTFNTLAPAYASDLMATGQGEVQSVVTFGGKRVFTVSGLGVFCESADRVATASLSSGTLNYALADPKVAIKLNTQYRKGAGTFNVTVTGDDQPPVTLGQTVTTSAASGNSVTLSVPQIVARNFEVGFDVNRYASDTTVGPVIDRWTFMVEPQPERRAKFTVPLRMHASEIDRNGAKRTYVPSEERARFYDLMRSRQVVPFQDYEQSYDVIVDDFVWVPYEQVGTKQKTWDGTLVVVCKVID